MSNLHIYSLPNLDYYTDDFVLRRKSRILDKAELDKPWFKQLVMDMLETLYADSSGVGLAAPQVGMSIRLVVIDVHKDAKKPFVLVNPTYVPLDDELVPSFETCLSIPLRSGEVKRFKKVLVKALDINGKEIELVGEKFLSNVYQHEIDHLDGILYIDKMDNLECLVSNFGYAASMAEKAFGTFKTETNKI